MILNLLVSILIFLFPLGELTRIELFPSVGITLNDILVGVILIVWILTALYKKRTLFPFPKEGRKGLITFIGIGFFSLCFNNLHLSSQEWIISLLYLLRWISYAYLYVVIAAFKLSYKKRLVTFIICSNVIFICLSVVQYQFYNNLRNVAYLGWDVHMYRIFSSFLDPNYTATICTFFIILTTAFLLQNNTYGIKWKKVLFTLTIGTFGILLLTYSRSGYVMFVASITLVCILLNKKKFIGVFVCVFLVGLLVIPKNLKSEGVHLLRTASIIGRTEEMQHAFIIIQNHPIAGVGFDAYRYAQKKYGFIKPSLAQEDHAGAGTDNSFLFLLATTGIIGLSGYILFWVLWCKHTYEEFKITSNSFQKAIQITCITSFVGLCINALFINSLFYPFAMEWIWIMFGISSNEKEN